MSVHELRVISALCLSHYLIHLIAASPAGLFPLDRIQFITRPQTDSKMTGQISVSIYEDEVSLPSRTNTWDSGLGYYPEIGNKLQIRRRKMKVGNEQNALAKTS